MTDTYRERCNDPAIRHAWQTSELVPLGSLPQGAVFECIDGTFWRKDRVTKAGTILCSRWGFQGGPEDVFIPDAMVRPQSLPKTKSEVSDE